MILVLKIAFHDPLHLLQCVFLQQLLSKILFHLFGFISTQLYGSHIIKQGNLIYMHENPFSYSSVVKPINQLFLQAYDDQVSTVRKSAVFCLVAIHTKVGDTIWNYLTKLNYSKVSILFSSYSY